MTKPFILFAALGLVPIVQASTLTLNPTADTRILSYYPSTNFGNDFISTYNASGNDQRSLLSFDLSSLGPSVVITSATLRLFGWSFFGSTAPTSIDMFRAVGTWSEASATWLNSSTGTPWNNSGGDFVGSTGQQATNPYTSTAVTPAGNTSIWFECDATQLTSEWVTGTSANNGMVITSPLGSQLSYNSRESGNFPQLVINYDPVPEPVTLVSLSFFAAALVQRRRRVLQ